MPGYGGYHSTYMDKIKAQGDFKPGDRVRVKSEYCGKTYAARSKRTGVWIVDHFLNANWVLKRPEDYKLPFGHPSRLRAKPYQIEKVPGVVGDGAPTHVQQLQKSLSKPSDYKPTKPYVPLAPGMIVTVDDPHGMIGKGLFVVTSCSPATVIMKVAELGVVPGKEWTANRDWVSPIPLENVMNDGTAFMITYP